MNYTIGNLIIIFYTFGCTSCTFCSYNKDNHKGNVQYKAMFNRRFTPSSSYISTTTSMVTTFTFSGRHRQPSRLYNSLGVSAPTLLLEIIAIPSTRIIIMSQPGYPYFDLLHSFWINMVPLVLVLQFRHDWCHNGINCYKLQLYR